jgi:hypothetical protein
MNTKVKFYDIDYDTDGESIDLPKEIHTTLDEMEYNNGDIDEFINEYGAEHISNTTGWCVNSFSFNVETNSQV